MEKLPGAIAAFSSVFELGSGSGCEILTPAGHSGCEHGIRL